MRADGRDLVHTSLGPSEPVLGDIILDRDNGLSFAQRRQLKALRLFIGQLAHDGDERWKRPDGSYKTVSDFFDDDQKRTLAEVDELVTPEKVASYEQSRDHFLAVASSQRARADERARLLTTYAPR
jgi:hypothetical protein